MKSTFGIDYEAGYLPEVPKDIKKSFKKAGIKLGKKAYIVFPYDEKGEPAFFIVIDGDKAHMVIDNNVYTLNHAGSLGADDLIMVSAGDIFDIVALENDAEYYKITPEGSPNVVALGFIYERLGLRHMVLPVADVIEVEGQKKYEIIKGVNAILEEEGIDLGFKPEDFKLVFVPISTTEEEAANEAQEQHEEVEEYEEYFPDEKEPEEKIEIADEE